MAIAKSDFRLVDIRDRKELASNLTEFLPTISHGVREVAYEGTGTDFDDDKFVIRFSNDHEIIVPVAATSKLAITKAVIDSL